MPRHAQVLLTWTFGDGSFSGVADPLTGADAAKGGTVVNRGIAMTP
jgi:hypothetical protein